MSSRAPKKGIRANDLKTSDASYMASPKGASAKGKKGVGKVKAKDAGSEESAELRAVRRRLSVISDNKLIEGFSELATTDAESEDKSKTGGHVITLFSGVSKKGFAPYNPAKKNQDSLLMVEDKESGAIFLGTLDGHGEAGDFVSQYIRNRLPDHVFGHPKFPADPGTAMKDALAAIEKSLLADKSIDTEFSGTTVVIATVIGDVLTVCNVGDSRLIIAAEGSGGKLVVDEVSKDHKPDDPKEMRRIEEAGGRVFAVEYDDGIDGPARVWLGHMDIPGLAMSRSLGDTVAHSAGVSSVPDIYTRKLTSKDKFLIVATDGLWEFMSNEECISMAAKYSSPRKAVEALVDEANKRWMKLEQVVDDTTVIVALLGA